MRLFEFPRQNAIIGWLKDDDDGNGSGSPPNCDLVSRPRRAVARRRFESHNGDQRLSLSLFFSEGF